MVTILMISNSLSAQVFMCKTVAITDYINKYLISEMSEENTKEYNIPFRISLENKVLKLKGKEFIYSDSEVSLNGNKFDYYKNKKLEVGLLYFPQSSSIGLTVNSPKLSVVSRCKTLDEWYNK